MTIIDTPLVLLAKQCGAIFYTPGPTRAIRGMAFTFDQLDALAERLRAEAGQHAAAPGAAERTLQRLGYQNRGGQEWAPPVGKAPDFDLIDSLRTRIAELEASATPVSSADAMAVLKAAFAADPEYAWSWHCAAWSCAHDEGLPTDAANRAAARLMYMAFGCDTTKNKHFCDEHRVAAPAVDALDAVRRAVRDYHHDLDTCRHGGIAASNAIDTIQAALGMEWIQGAEASARAAQAKEAGGAA